MTPTPLSDSEELEKVARAICEADKTEWAVRTGFDLWAVSQEQYRNFARAAIKAMRSHSQATGDGLATQVPEAPERDCLADDAEAFADALRRANCATDKEIDESIRKLREHEAAEARPFSSIRKRHDSACFVGPRARP